VTNSVGLWMHGCARLERFGRIMTFDGKFDATGVLSPPRLTPDVYPFPNTVPNPCFFCASHGAMCTEGHFLLGFVPTPVNEAFGPSQAIGANANTRPTRSALNMLFNNKPIVMRFLELDGRSAQCCRVGRRPCSSRCEGVHLTVRACRGCQHG
jgi:hypothetical protein